jgi:SAM-dependent methyltransferase
MMSQIDWELEWKNVQSKAILSKCRVNGHGFSGYFDSVAEDYLKQVRADEKFYRGIVDHLERERFLKDDDDVLDIACGPGTYTLPFAERVKAVAGLDPSEGMLSVLMREAGCRGLSNVREIRSKWEDYTGGERYDLVFTALSPGITGPETFMKMERFSRRSCCYIGFGNGSNNELSDRLWELVIGEKKNDRGFNVTYPFNLLCSKGRKPNVRFFEKESVEKQPCEEIIKSNVEWLGLFTEMNGEKEKKVREYVMARSTCGYYERKAKQSLVALYWDVPGE